MISKLKLVRIDSTYCNYLRKFDNRVIYNMGSKELRPFIGILFNINDLEYFAPLSSPKLKHKNMRNTIDFFKIDNGILGAINFNNMIPVKEDNYNVINVNNKESIIYNIKYQELLKNQLNWLNKNYIQVQSKACKLYNLYNNGKLPKSIMNRCCNFKLLDEKCILYNNKTRQKITS